VLARGIVSPDTEGTELRIKEARGALAIIMERQDTGFHGAAAQYTVNENTERVVI
jgi:hypothetical protein